MIRIVLGLLCICAGVQQAWSGADFHPPEVQELLEKLKRTCIQKLGLDEAVVNSYNMESGTATTEMMCYMKCLMLEGSWSEHDETVKYDFIEEDMHKDIKHIYMPMVDQCRVVQDGNTDCEKTYNFFVCLHKADPVHFYLP